MFDKYRQDQAEAAQRAADEARRREEEWEMGAPERERQRVLAVQRAEEERAARKRMEESRSIVKGRMDELGRIIGREIVSGEQEWGGAKHFLDLQYPDANTVISTYIPEIRHPDGSVTIGNTTLSSSEVRDRDQSALEHAIEEAYTNPVVERVFVEPKPYFEPN